MNKIFLFTLVFAATAFFGCLPVKQTGSTSKSEDLSVYRPKYDAANVNIQATPQDKPEDTIFHEPSQDVTEEVNKTLATAYRNEKDNYTMGYTIQVYSGTSRDRADYRKSLVYQIIPDARPKIDWNAPNYKVRVGNYIEKLEAHKVYTQIKKEIPQAILIPIKVYN